MPKAQTAAPLDPSEAQPIAGAIDIDADLELRKIVEKNREVAGLSLKSDNAKERAKQAKEAWEIAAQELQDMIAELGREYPLFDRKGSTP
jgi:hypothetical protein